MKPTTSAAPRPRRATPAELGAAVCFFLATLVLTGTLLQHRLAQRQDPVKDDPLAGTVIVPSVAQEGVVVTPGRGRLLFVDSTPGGAAVRLDGAARGETPFSTDFACQEGQPAVLELEKAGYRPSRFELDCVSGSTRVSATLKRAR
ncbi:MAG: PEGA domain-containing protein [Archangium sp.]|nr:PEGA domain-containing protein [Archangium sp.]